MIRFNNEQLEAIRCDEGIFAVSASSGSGKSTLMVERCRRLVKEKGIDPKRILITTFTNASARDLKKKLKNVDCEDVETGTFHSVCQRVLCANGIITYNNLIEYKITNEFRKIVDKPMTKDILGWIGYQKNCNIKPQDSFIYKECGKYSEEELRNLYIAYENLKTRNKCLDFEDWLLIAIDLLKEDNIQNEQFKYDYIMIDEHQDSNKLQMELIKLFCPKDNIFMVFDPKQQLYGFRGSNSDYCLHIENYFLNVKRLYVSTNYRSCKNIVENSNDFARLYYGKYDSYKDSISFSKEDGNIERLKFNDKEMEAEYISLKIKELLDNGVEPNEIAVLYRNNKNVFSLENQLKTLDIPYFLANTSNNFFNRKEIKFIVSILRLIENINDDDAFETIFDSRLDNNLKFLTKNIKEDIISLANKKKLNLFETSDLLRVEKPWQMKNINNFKDMIYILQSRNNNKESLCYIVESILKFSKLQETITENANSEEELEERLQSIKDLKSFIKTHTIESFLKHVYSSSKPKKTLDKKSIVLSTFHGSKGLEWDNVFLIGLNEKYPNMNKCENILDECNTFYVAVTRARINMWLSEIDGGNLFIKEYFGDK